MLARSFQKAKFLTLPGCSLGADTCNSSLSLAGKWDPGDSRELLAGGACRCPMPSEEECPVASTAGLGHLFHSALWLSCIFMITLKLLENWKSVP